jgi:hypothetical protein
VRQLRLATTVPYTFVACARDAPVAMTKMHRAACRTSAR